MRVCVLFVALVLLLTGQAYAAEYPEQETERLLEQQIEISGAQSLADALPDQAYERYSGFSDLRQADLAEGVQQILSSSISDVGTGIRAALQSAGKLLAVCVLCAVVRLFAAQTSPNAVQIAGVLAVTLISASDLNTLVGLGRTSMEEISAFSAVLLPLMAAATTASGAPASAAALYAGTAFFTQLLNRVMLNVFLPLSHACLACACAEYALSDPLLHRLRKLLQAIVANGLKVLLICFSAYLAVTGVVSGSADSVSIKAAKLALSSVVPVVGSVIADASETVLVSAGMLRSAVGITGLLGVLAVCVAPFLRLGLQYLTLKTTAALGAVLEDSKVVDMIDAAADTMGLILGMVGTAALFNLIACVCLMRTAVSG